MQPNLGFLPDCISVLRRIITPDSGSDIDEFSRQTRETANAGELGNTESVNGESDNGELDNIVQVATLYRTSASYQHGNCRIQPTGVKAALQQHVMSQILLDLCA